MTRPTMRTTTDERISDTVIEALAIATGADPLDLPPVSETIDLDGLDRLFSHDPFRESGGRIEFAVADCEVCIDADGRVVVVPSRSDEERAAPEP